MRGRDSGRVRASRARLPAAAISEQLRRLLSRRLQRLVRVKARVRASLRVRVKGSGSVSG